MKEYLEEGKKSYSRHYDEIFNDKKIYRKSWIKLGIILLEELKEVCKERNITDVDIFIAIPLTWTSDATGVRFKNEKELSDDYIDNLGQTPELCIISKKYTHDRKIKINRINFELVDFIDSRFKFYYAEDPPNQYLEFYNRWVYLKFK